MAIERVFLGWDGPCLSRAADWLHAHYPPAQSWDLSDVLIVTPSSRASRRLLEILVERTAAAPLLPPTLITPGDLPEKLYKPTTPIADELQTLLAHVHALRSVDPTLLQKVVAEPPGDDDIAGWLALSRDLETVYAALAAGGVRPGSVTELCRDIDDFHQEERWDAIHQLWQAYESLLTERGLQDRHAARFQALTDGVCRASSDIVLIATADLDEIVKKILRQVGDRIWSLVHAPETEASGFDDLGCLLPEQWTDRKLDLDPTIVHVVDRPRDQAREVLRLLDDDSTATLGGKHAPDQVTIGLGDDAMASLIERTLGFADVPTHAYAGRSVSQTGPALLLAGLARYLQRERFDDLASLLRHPDVESYLLQTVTTDEQATADWLTLLDRYISEHLQGTSTKTWLGDPSRAARLKAVHDAVRALVPPDFAKPRPLPHWSEPIAAVLEHIYGKRSLNRTAPDDAAVIGSLQLIGEALRQQSLLRPDDRTVPHVDFSDAVAFTLGRISDQDIRSAAHDGPAVELVGWLDLQLDDAPALIVTGVNEGKIPQSVNTDAFLPDHVRGKLGLTDNRRRYARDLMMLTAILHSRPDVRLITGRRNGDDDPLTPSRLLLACSNDLLARRVIEFYGDGSDDSSSRATPLLAHGHASRFTPPRPHHPAAQIGNEPPAAPLTSLRVTAFRDYIACPYRFYLRHVRRLESIDDQSIELDGAAFGRLAHEVVQSFGRSDLADTDDDDAIYSFLSRHLDQLARLRFGNAPPPPVLIQIEQLRSRFRALARWQAQQSQEGWRVIRANVEAELAVALDVDGQPFTVTGRIDRIDRHPEHGCRILDYKTADTAMTPHRVHRVGDRWVDLQLPLYAELITPLGLPGPISLGFVQLPKDLRKVGLALAGWSPEELRDATQEGRRVIRQIRRGVFWPPAAPPQFADDFSRICMDDCLDRAEAISLEPSPLGRGGKK